LKKNQTNRNVYIDNFDNIEKEVIQMALFGKKKIPGAAEGIPTDRVIQMRQQGYSNDQIIQGLQREGYNSSQIFDAMSQADIKGTVEGEYQPIPPGAAMPQEMPPAMPEPMHLPEMPPMPAAPAIDRAAIEEVAESIIDEKWEELMKNVDKIVAWKEETEVKIAKMQQRIKDLRERFEVLHTGILGKISEYDKGIKGVSTDIQAMGEVFKKVLPTLTANVGELSRITKKIKRPSSQK